MIFDQIFSSFLAQIRGDAKERKVENDGNSSISHHRFVFHETLMNKFEQVRFGKSWLSALLMGVSNRKGLSFLTALALPLLDLNQRPSD
jgi:hypothetical protein